jgi:hypothetical protein
MQALEGEGLFGLAGHGVLHERASMFLVRSDPVKLGCNDPKG